MNQAKQVWSKTLKSAASKKALKKMAKQALKEFEAGQFKPI